MNSCAKYGKLGEREKTTGLKGIMNGQVRLDKKHKRKEKKAK